MSRMFEIEGSPMKTWNVFIGCRYECSYCNVRRLVRTRLKDTERYRAGFEPRLIPELLPKRYKDGTWVFVAYMGDISFIERADLVKILSRVEHNAGCNYLFLTKSPGCYLVWQTVWNIELPDNVYLGATIETNRDYQITKAPPPATRALLLSTIRHDKKFVSIEPLLDFDLRKMVKMVKDVSPDIIEIGPDNYHNKLPEPSPKKVRRLLEELRNICPTVVEKKGIERLKEE